MEREMCLFVLDEVPGISNAHEEYEAKFTGSQYLIFKFLSNKTLHRYLQAKSLQAELLCLNTNLSEEGD